MTLLLFTWSTARFTATAARTDARFTGTAARTDARFTGTAAPR